MPSRADWQPSGCTHRWVARGHLAPTSPHPRQGKMGHREDGQAEGERGK